jgi:hygromycin-B 7''-O-kinase
MPSSSTLLPGITTLDEYRPIYREVDTWLPALREICRRHGLDASTLDFAPPGSNVVFWVERDRLIKLFPPIFAADCAREQLALAALADQVSFDVPRIHAAGELEGWPYLVLSRLEGAALDEIWGDLDPSGRLRIAEGLGGMMAELHRTPAVGLQALGPDWVAFIRGQAQSLLETQRAAGVSVEWLGDLAEFYAGLPPLVEPGFQPVLINADLNPEHIFCRQDAAGWEVSGIIDFGDAMLGHPYYEFVCPGLILAGEPALGRAMLLAYGLPPTALDAELARLLTAHILLHRFFYVTQFDELFKPSPPRNMRELQAVVWGF